MVPRQVRASTALGRRFWVLLGAAGLSNLADGMFKVALPLVAVTLTRSPFLVASLEVLRATPWLVFSLPAGALTDRWDRRTTMIVADVVRASLLVVAASSLAADVGGLWLLFPVALATGVAEVFHDTASQTILPSIVDTAVLAKANARILATEQSTQLFFGPPLAAVVFGLGAGGVIALGLPGLLWIGAAIVLVTLRGRFKVSKTESVGSLRSEIATGVRYLYRHPVLRRWATISACGNLCISATLSILVLRAFGDDTSIGLGLNERGYALLLLAVAGGSILGTFVVERVLARLGLARTVTLGIVGLSSLVIAPGLSDNAIVVWVFLFVGGAGNTLFNVPTLSYRQKATAEELLGRVNSAFRFLAWGTIPLGAVIGGLIGELVSVRAVFLVVGVGFAGLLLIDRAIDDEMLEANAKPSEAGAAG